mmetsp:Transcript_46127/g.106441  ORF Transcript_46127/g.106441 Transcript_46127/m.106441 type:complete len:405 (+) Transcript_46127:7-1221(+)
MASRSRVLRGLSLVAEQLGKEVLPDLRKAVLFASRPVGPPLPGAAPAAHTATHSAGRHAASALSAPSAGPTAANPSSVVQGMRDVVKPPVPFTAAAVSVDAAASVSTHHAPAAESGRETPAAQPPAAAHHQGAMPADILGEDEEAPRTLHVEAVPSTSLSRAYHFGMLGASVLSSGFGELARRRVTSAFGGEQTAEVQSARTAFVNERNAEHMAKTLTKLRGAALKIGQLLSLQDEGAMPAQMQAVFAKVRASANIMPQGQLHATLATELGSDWRSKVRSFQETPLAAASIGQVHRVVLKDGRLAALKVQYPGVAESVDSDLANLRRLAQYTGALPKTLFVDNIIKGRYSAHYSSLTSSRSRGTNCLRNAITSQRPHTRPDMANCCNPRWRPYPSSLGSCARRG